MGHNQIQLLQLAQLSGARWSSFNCPLLFATFVSMKQTLSLLVLSFALAFVSCKKDPVPGPEGPAGPAGPQGPTGSEGSANVSSVTFTTTFNLNSPQWDVQLLAPEITWEIYTFGVILVYKKTTAGNGWLALPYTFPVTNTYSRTYGSVIKVGQLDLRVVDSDLVDPPNPGTWTVKLVTIPEETRMAHPDLDLSDYPAVAARFDLN